MTFALLQRPFKTRLEIQELDGEIATRIAQEASTARNRNLLFSTTGRGALTAGAVLKFLPEIAALGRKQVASLAGGAPFRRPSASRGLHANHCQPVGKW